jgi:hypothetical protein
VQGEYNESINNQPIYTMSINVVTQPEQTVSLSAVEVLAVRDLFSEQTIIARVKGLPRPVVLWKGEADYTAAGNWTNDSAAAQATAVLSLSSIPWA